MKKLMIAASAALCATVGFSDVTSANVVGYNTVNKGEGQQYSMIGNIFQGVDGSEILDLNDLKGDFKQDDQIQLVKMVDSDIVFDFDIYTYYDEDNYWMVWLDEAGWADADGWAPDGVGFDLGRGGYFITASGDGQNAQTSGQVKNVAHTHIFDDQYTIMNSAFPLALNPQDSRFDWAVPQDTQIQVVKMVDSPIIFDFDIYTYYDEDNYWMVWLDEAGWADADGWAPEGDIVGAGSGFYLIFPGDADPTEWGLVEASPIAKQAE